MEHDRTQTESQSGCTRRADQKCECSTTQTTPSEEAGIKEVFLANFCDGDSWEAADASSFTKHGALDIANFFYEKGVRDSLEVGRKTINEAIQTSHHPEQAWYDGLRCARESIDAAISTLLT